MGLGEAPGRGALPVTLGLWHSPPAGTQFWARRAASVWTRVHGSPDIALTLVNGHNSFLSLIRRHFTGEKNSHPFICRGRQRLKMQMNTGTW